MFGMINWLKKHSKWATYFILGAALIAVYKTFDSLDFLVSIFIGVFNAFKPFLLAFVIAYMLNIPTKKLKNTLEKYVKYKYVKKHANGISITVVYLIAIALVMWLIGAIIPAITSDLLEMYDNVPLYAQNIVNYTKTSELAQKVGFAPEALDLEKKFTDLIGELLSPNAMRDGFKTITTGIWSLASGFMNIFIAIIASIYMLIDKDRILESINNLVGKFDSNHKNNTFIKHCSNINKIFTQYIYARLMLCVIIGCASTLLLLLMGEKYALLLGIFIGFMDLIPYFGSIISWVVGLVIMLISGGFSHAIWCSLMVLVLQQIDGNVIAPKLTSDRLEVRPLAVIIAVSVGGSLFGFVGMLISVPVVAILKAILSEILDSKLLESDEDE